MPSVVPVVLSTIGGTFATITLQISIPNPTDIAGYVVTVAPFSRGNLTITPLALTYVNSTTLTINSFAPITTWALNNVVPGNNYINIISSNGTAVIATVFFNYLEPPVVCFKSDSKILTDKGYVAVQNLKKGDLVKTLKDGFVPINAIGKRDIHHVASEERIKDQLYKCSKEQYPELLEDLVITGCHSILVDSFASEEQRNRVIEINGNTFVTDKKYRLPAAADHRASVYKVAGNHTIYHFALENDDYYMNYGVYANGLLVETCSKRFLKELSGMKLL